MGPDRYGPQKVPYWPTFLVNFFGLYFMKLFMRNNPFFMVFVVQIDGKCFFLRFLKKKSKNLTFWMISPNNHVHTGHFIITKFCQDAKKTILVKVWPLIKSLLAVCHSTADPKSLNFISKCIFMDRDRSVSAQMGFFIQIMAIANRKFHFWLIPAHNGCYWPIGSQFLFFEAVFDFFQVFQGSLKFMFSKFLIIL